MSAISSKRSAKDRLPSARVWVVGTIGADGRTRSASTVSIRSGAGAARLDEAADEVLSVALVHPRALTGSRNRESMIACANLVKEDE